MIRTTRARASRRWLLLVATLAIAVSVLAAGTSGQAATTYDDEELRFLQLINDYREDNGLRPLVLSDTLTVSSERHSRDMAEYGFFAHDTERSSYYPNGAKPWDRMEADGYDYNTAKGENLAVGYQTADETMRAWQESPSHDAAMLDGDYRVMGVARINVPESEHGWYWTTDFGGVVDPSARTAGEDPAAPEPPDEQQSPPANPVNPAPPQPQEPRDAGTQRSTDTGNLENGALGAAGVWRQEARDGADLVVDDGTARLGGYHDGLDDLQQKVRIGENDRLAYDLKVRGGVGDADDRLLVRLTDGKGEQIAVLDRYSGRADAGRNRERVDLSRYAGRTVFLSFRVRTDADRLTIFYLDDIALRR